MYTLYSVSPKDKALYAAYNPRNLEHEIGDDETPTGGKFNTLTVCNCAAVCYHVARGASSNNPRRWHP